MNPGEPNTEAVCIERIVAVVFTGLSNGLMLLWLLHTVPRSALPETRVEDAIQIVWSKRTPMEPPPQPRPTLAYEVAAICIGPASLAGTSIGGVRLRHTYDAAC